MRVCMLISNPFPPQEGIGYYVYSLSREMVKNGHSVTVVTRGVGALAEDHFEGMDIVRLPFYPIYPFHITIHGLFLENYLRSHDNEFDLIHVHTPLTPIPKNNTCPIVSTIHTSMVGNANSIDEGGFRSAAIKVVTRTTSVPILTKLAKKSALVCTVSESVASELKDTYDADHVEVVHNAVDTSLFSPVNRKRSTRNILYVGRLSYGKGLFELVETAKLLIENSRQEIKFVLCGKGELEPELRNLVKKNSLDDYFLFMGQVPHKQLVEVLNDAEIFFFPSHYEGLPTAVLEAMSCGLPVVVKDIPSYSHLIDDGLNGFLARNGTPMEYFDIMLRLLNDPELEWSVGDEARRTVEREYSADRLYETMVKHYESVIERWSQRKF